MRGLSGGGAGPTRDHGREDRLGKDLDQYRTTVFQESPVTKESLKKVNGNLQDYVRW